MVRYSGCHSQQPSQQPQQPWDTRCQILWSFPIQHLLAFHRFLSGLSFPLVNTGTSLPADRKGMDGEKMKHSSFGFC